MLSRHAKNVLFTLVVVISMLAQNLSFASASSQIVESKTVSPTASAITPEVLPTGTPTLFAGPEAVPSPTATFWPTETSSPAEESILPTITPTPTLESIPTDVVTIPTEILLVPTEIALTPTETSQPTAEPPGETPTVTSTPENPTETPTVKVTPEIPTITPTATSTPVITATTPTLTPTEVPLLISTEPVTITLTPQTPEELVNSVLAETPDPDMEKITVGTDKSDIVVSEKGAEVTGLEGRLKVRLNKAVLPEALSLTVQYVDLEQFFGVSLSGRPFEITARSLKDKETTEDVLTENDEGDIVIQTKTIDKPEKWKTIHRFNKYFPIQLQYEEKEFAPENESKLKLFYYDEVNRMWLELPSVVDTEKNIITGVSDHMTIFDYSTDNEPEDVFIPSLDGINTNGANGNASYTLPLDAPSGPGGIQIPLSLSYNSQVVDESPINMQGFGFIGLGWSLDTSTITRNTHQTETLTDDTWNLHLGGAGGMLVKDSNDIYHVDDETFTKIDFSAGNDVNYVWTTDGTKYTFTAIAVYDTCPKGTSHHHYGYYLTQIMNKFGQTVNFTYTHENHSKTCGSNTIYRTAWVQPETITYGSNGIYKVLFDYEARHDYLNNDHDRLTSVEDNRIIRIRFQIYENGAWSNIGGYNFIYQTESQIPTATGIVLPNYMFYNDNHHSLLIGVTQFVGSSYTNTLPQTSFIYGDNLHLTQVHNGYGGAVVFNYEKITETIQTAWHDNYPDKGWYQYYSDNHCSRGTSAWVATAGSVLCSSNEDYLVLSDDVENADRDAGMRTHVPATVGGFVQAGWYRIKTDVHGGNIANMRVRLQVVNDTDVQEFANVSTANQSTEAGKFMADMYLPAQYANKKNLYFRFYCLGTCSFKNMVVLRLPTHYRVLSKTIYNAGEAISTETYTYDGTATNNPEVSASASADTPYIKPYTMSRGNNSFSATNSDGLTTTTYYYQDDNRSGRQHLSFTMDRDVYDNFNVNDASISSSWSSTFPKVRCNESASDCTLIKYEGDEYAVFNGNMTAIQNSTGLTNGKSAVFQFRLASNGNMTFSLKAANSNSTVADLNVNYGQVALNGTLLGSGLVAGRWYVAMISMLDGKVMARVWERDQICWNRDANGICAETYNTYTRFGVANLSGAGPYNFAVYNSEGVNYFDEYSSGTLYAVNDSYYQDMKVNASMGWTTIDPVTRHWARLKESTSMSLESGGWMWSRQTTDSYDAYNYPLQTTSYEYKQASSSFEPYRTDITTYAAPKTSASGTDDPAYIIGLPAQEVAYACSSSNCSGTGATLSGLTEYLYDNHPPFNAPTYGKLTDVRKLVTGSSYLYTSYIYDDYGNQIQEKTYTGLGSGGGNVGPVRPSGVRTTSTAYDATGTFPTSQTNAAGHVTTVTYNYQLGKPTSITNPNGSIVNFTYTGLGRLYKVRRSGMDDDPLPALTAMNYSLENSRYMVESWKKIDNTPRYTHIRTFYNGIGQKIQTQEVGISIYNPTSGTTTQNIIVNYTYDAMGRLIRQSVPYGVTPTDGYVDPDNSQPYTSTTYDVLGRAIDTRTTNNAHTAYVYSITDGQSATSVTDPKSNTSITYSDIWGRIVKVHPPTGTDSLPETNYNYDVFNRLKTATYGSTTTYFTYDLVGQKAGQSGNDTGTWYYSYDGAGNLTGQYGPRACAVEMAYDSLNRMIRKYNAACDSLPATYYHYFYDAGTNGIGQRTSMDSTDSNGTIIHYTTWTYDAWGKVLSGRLAFKVNDVDTDKFLTTWNDYNAAGLPGTMSYPDGNGGNTWETINYSYNVRKQVTGMYSTSPAENYLWGTGFDAAGRSLVTSFGASLFTANQYNAWTVNQGKLYHTYSGVSGDVTRIANMYYDSYDANGNVQGFMDLKDSNPNSVIRLFSYDTANRLVKERTCKQDWTGCADAETYQYDAATGNLKSKGTSYTYDPDNIHAVTNNGNGITASYRDANQSMTYNMTRRTVNGVPTNFQYDAENRLVRASNNTTTYSVVYDGDGNKVKTALAVTAGNIITTTTTWYVGNYYEWIMTEKTGVTTTWTWNKYYYSGSQRIAMRNPSGVQYLFADQLGSTRAWSNGTGTVHGNRQYKPWGETDNVPAPAAPTDYLFTGQRDLASLGIYDYQARFYDPLLGRFLQPDSIIPDPYNPMSWDRYAYTNNNPVNFTDPTGHWIETALDIGFIAYDIYDVGANGLTWSSGLSLVADIVCAALPIATGGGLAIRAVLKASKSADKVADAVKVIDKADNAIDIINQGDNFIDVVTHADEVVDGAGQVIKDSYRRPSGFRNGVKDKVWEAARGQDGLVRDPGSGTIMEKTQPWDMGHKPGYEFRKHQQSAKERGITRKQFLDEYNDPAHYRPEDPSSNRSHLYEDPTNTYFGY